MQGSVELSQQLPAKHKQAPVPRAHREAQISLEAAGDVPPPRPPRLLRAASSSAYFRKR